MIDIIGHKLYMYAAMRRAATIDQKFGALNFYFFACFTLFFVDFFYSYWFSLLKVMSVKL